MHDFIQAGDQYASRYVSPEEIVDFAHDNELFCILGRELPEGKMIADQEEWAFEEYGICLGYLLDDESKPAGKWLWMHFASLASFPPVRKVFKLQPPHVLKGQFQDPGRVREFRIVKVTVRQTGDSGAGKNVTPPPLHQKEQDADIQTEVPPGAIKSYNSGEKARNSGAGNPVRENRFPAESKEPSVRERVFCCYYIREIWCPVRKNTPPYSAYRSRKLNLATSPARASGT
ncbi:MAG: hypothetical protein MZV70_77380 [Desulfobacterales bacterium]|nr:hypothetical protein [Desulfobacterales bacterium]